MWNSIFRGIAKPFSNGLSFWFGAAVSVIAVSVAFAAWNSIPRASNGAPLSSSAWNAMVDSVEYLSGQTAPRGMQKFTSNGTFSVPAGISTVYVSMTAGGGGGAGGSSQSSQSIWAAGGGGGAAVMKQTVAIPVWTTTVAVTVGSWWAGWAVWASWSDGTATSFGSYVTAAGWKGATYLWWANGGAAGWPGGTDGEPSHNDSTNWQPGGRWGSTMFWGGGAGWANANPPYTANGYVWGSYGGGGGGAGGGVGTGWAGASWFVLVEW